MARSAGVALSAGISTNVTSGFAARTRRVTGSEPATGKLAQVWTVRATLVPSTSTWSTARCSLSVATMTTESSGISNAPSSHRAGKPTYSTATRKNTQFLFAVLIKLAVLDKRFRVLWQRRRLRGRRNPPNRAKNHQLRVALLQALTAKEISQDRDISEAGNLAVNVGDAVVHQARDHETLAILQFKFGLSAARTECRNGESGNRKGVGEIEGADFRSDFQMYVSARHDHGREC